MRSTYLDIFFLFFHELLRLIFLRSILFCQCRCGGMVDAADSKSALSNRVLVRVQSSAHPRTLSRKGSVLYHFKRLTILYEQVFIPQLQVLKYKIEKLSFSRLCTNLSCCLKQPFYHHFSPSLHFWSDIFYRKGNFARLCTKSS